MQIETHSHQSSVEQTDLFESEKHSLVTPFAADDGAQSLLDETNLNDLQSLNSRLMQAEDELLTPLKASPKKQMFFNVRSFQQVMNYPSDMLSPVKSADSQIKDITNIHVEQLDEQSKLDYSVSDITDDLQTLLKQQVSTCRNHLRQHSIPQLNTDLVSINDSFNFSQLQHTPSQAESQRPTPKTQRDGQQYEEENHFSQTPIKSLHQRGCSQQMSSPTLGFAGKVQREASNRRQKSQHYTRDMSDTDMFTRSSIEETLRSSQDHIRQLLSKLDQSSRELRNKDLHVSYLEEELRESKSAYDQKCWELDSLRIEAQDIEQSYQLKLTRLQSQVKRSEQQQQVIQDQNQLIAELQSQIKQEVSFQEPQNHILAQHLNLEQRQLLQVLETKQKELIQQALELRQGVDQLQLERTAVQEDRYSLELERATIVPKFSRGAELFWNCVIVGLIVYIVYCQ